MRFGGEAAVRAGLGLDAHEVAAFELAERRIRLALVAVEARELLRACSSTQLAAAPDS
jgi:hypothetical protein